MSRTRRTTRVAIEDMFATLPPSQRESVLEFLQSWHRLKTKEEARNGKPSDDRPPIQTCTIPDTERRAMD